MSKKINQIVELLKTLTLLEASELVTLIEQTFEVDSSISIGSNLMVPSTETVEEIEEKTEFSVSLDEVPSDKKIAIIKVVRSLTTLGLKEAKGLVESAPKIILEAIKKDTAEEAKKQIESVGGKVSLK